MCRQGRRDTCREESGSHEGGLKGLKKDCKTRSMKEGEKTLGGQDRLKTANEGHGSEEGEVKHSQRLFWSYEKGNENR